jgi:hypothetical protein
VQRPHQALIGSAGRPGLLQCHVILPSIGRARHAHIVTVSFLVGVQRESVIPPLF